MIQAEATRYSSTRFFTKISEWHNQCCFIQTTGIRPFPCWIGSPNSLVQEGEEEHKQESEVAVEGRPSAGEARSSLARNPYPSP
ncbi:hypothetical protein ACROYT_G014418 [Oculina patagonica]